MMAAFGRGIWRLLKWLLAAGAGTLVLACLPVAYVELACRGDCVRRPCCHRPGEQCGLRRLEPRGGR